MCERVYGRAKLALLIREVSAMLGLIASMTTLVVCAPELRLDLTGTDSHEIWQKWWGEAGEQ